MCEEGTVCAQTKARLATGRGAPLHEGMMVPQYSFSRRPDATASCQVLTNILPIFPFVSSLCSTVTVAREEEEEEEEEEAGLSV
jgi:hypothetical protein